MKKNFFTYIAGSILMLFSIWAGITLLKSGALRENTRLPEELDYMCISSNLEKTIKGYRNLVSKSKELFPKSVSNDSVFAVFTTSQTQYSSKWKEIDGVVFYDSLLWRMEDETKPGLQDGVFIHGSLSWKRKDEKNPDPGWAKDNESKEKHIISLKYSTLNNLDIRARNLYLSGCINSVDKPNPDWGGGDGYRTFFLGDTTGILRIKYTSGIVDEIPLVFGYTAWWQDSYKFCYEPFYSDEAARTMLNDALCVLHGIDGYKRTASDYYLKIVLRDENVEGIDLIDNPEKIGYYVVNGISFGNPENKEKLDINQFTLRRASALISKERADSINSQLIYSDHPFPENRKEAINVLRHKLYTSIDDISEKVIEAAVPDITPESFPGPKVTFKGSPIATLLTRIYYENSMVVMNSIDDEGMSHESVKNADYYGGFGTWHPNLQAFYDKAYTRLRTLMVLSNYGMAEKVNKCIGFFDKWMMYFPQSYPELQLGGKPVPGHATVIANYPHIYFDELRHIGWRTKFSTRDFGNPENDGHGLLMINRFRAWTKQGKDPGWVIARWEAINEAAEYIPWALENPELSFSQHGLLHNETEGGMMKQSMYCDFLCYMGLLGYAEMAEVAAKTSEAKRWRSVADKMYKAMDVYYPLTDSTWGDVWDPDKSSMFLYFNSTLAPACMGMDFYGYDVMNILSDDWSERTKRTYAMQLAQCEPEFAASAGMGYGQSYITQAGLLLDRMNDAKRSVEWMARLCYSPRLDHPYRVPEGATISADAKTWRRWGDLGNLYQTCDVVHTIHLMLGIDDIRPGKLKLMPRITEDISYLKIEDWPTRITSSNESILTKMDVEMDINRRLKTIEYKLHSDDTIDSGMIRLGPLPANAKKLEVLLNGNPVPYAQSISGDANWVWIEFGNIKSPDFKVKY